MSCMLHIKGRNSVRNKIIHLESLALCPGLTDVEYRYAKKAEAYAKQ